MSVYGADDVLCMGNIPVSVGKLKLYELKSSAGHGQRVGREWEDHVLCMVSSVVVDRKEEREGADLRRKHTPANRLTVKSCHI